MRKLTDVGNPDCTFSDPKFIPEGEEQSLISSINRDEENQAVVTAQIFQTLRDKDNSFEKTETRQHRAASEEAHFGSSSEKSNDEEKKAYEA